MRPRPRESLIADQGWRTPATCRETFQVLGEEGALDPALARTMEGWAGLRNALVHLDQEVDPARVYDVLREDLESLERDARALARASQGG